MRFAQKKAFTLAGTLLGISQFLFVVFSPRSDLTFYSTCNSPCNKEDRTWTAFESTTIGAHVLGIFATLAIAIHLNKEKGDNPMSTIRTTGVESIGYAHISSVLTFVIFDNLRAKDTSDFEFGLQTAVVLGLLYGPWSPCIIILASTQLRRAALAKFGCPVAVTHTVTQPSNSQPHQPSTIMTMNETFNGSLFTNPVFTRSSVFTVSGSMNRTKSYREDEISDKIFREVQMIDLEEENMP